MTQPRDVYRLKDTDFQATAICLGDQLAEVIATVSKSQPELQWYGADFITVGLQLVPEKTPMPVQLGRTEAFFAKLSGIDQFFAGVFIGVPKSIESPRFRAGGIWTEDQPEVDLCDSVVEIRAFDTSFIEIITTDNCVSEALLSRFGKSALVIDS